MKEEPELIGGETCARGAVREQVVLVLLDHKLHRSPSGVARLINEPAEKLKIKEYIQAFIKKLHIYKYS